MTSNDDLIWALSQSPLRTNKAIYALAATVGAVTTGPGAGPAVGMTALQTVLNEHYRRRHDAKVETLLEKYRRRIDTLRAAQRTLPDGARFTREHELYNLEFHVIDALYGNAYGDGPFDTAAQLGTAVVDVVALVTGAMELYDLVVTGALSIFDLELYVIDTLYGNAVAPLDTAVTQIDTAAQLDSAVESLDIDVAPIGDTVAPLDAAVVSLVGASVTPLGDTVVPLDAAVNAVACVPAGVTYIRLMDEKPSAERDAWMSMMEFRCHRAWMNMMGSWRRRGNTHWMRMALDQHWRALEFYAIDALDGNAVASLGDTVAPLDAAVDPLGTTVALLCTVVPPLEPPFEPPPPDSTLYDIDALDTARLGTVVESLGIDVAPLSTAGAQPGSAVESLDIDVASLGDTVAPLGAAIASLGTAATPFGDAVTPTLDIAVDPLSTVVPPLEPPLEPPWLIDIAVDPLSTAVPPLEPPFEPPWLIDITVNPLSTVVPPLEPPFEPPPPEPPPPEPPPPEPPPPEPPSPEPMPVAPLDIVERCF